MRRIAVLLALLVGLGALASPAGAATSVHRTATFVAGSGNYLLVPGGTDGLSQLGGHVTVTQAKAGAPIKVTGVVTGLQATTLYVAVPYKDGECIPAAGLTAFPSGAFVTNASGVARIPAGVTVNPRAINPLGVVNVAQVHSISVRQVVLSARALPPLPGYPNGLPKGTPTLPNVAAVEGCDRTLTQ